MQYERCRDFGLIFYRSIVSPKKDDFFIVHFVSRQLGGCFPKSVNTPLFSFSARFEYGCFETARCLETGFFPHKLATLDDEIQAKLRVNKGSLACVI